MIKLKTKFVKREKKINSPEIKLQTCMESKEQIRNLNRNQIENNKIKSQKMRLFNYKTL